MDKQPGKQPVRPELTAGEALCAAIEGHVGHLYVQMSPMKAILPLLVAHVRATEKRLAALEQPMRRSGPPELQAQLQHIVDVGKAEGQL